MCDCADNKRSTACSHRALRRSSDAHTLSPAVNIFTDSMAALILTPNTASFFLDDDDDDDDFKHTDYSADAASEIGYAVAVSNNTHFTFHLN